VEAALKERPLVRRRLALLLTLAGAGLLVVSAFLPQDSAVSAPLPANAATASSLWHEGLGWTLVAAAGLLAVLTLRAHARGTASWSWAGVWVGLLATINAVVLAGTESFKPVGAGIVVLGLSGVVILGGWVLGFVSRRPPIRGLSSGRSLSWRQVRTAVSPASAQPRRARRLQVGSPVVWSLALYGALSVLFWGLPVLSDFGSTLIAENSIDPSVYTWFYAWWPHALVDGLNPFITKAIFAPEGYNLTWVTAVPGPSLLMTPVTLTLGPVVTYNLLALLSPSVVSWAAFLLCRHLTGSVAPSLVAGYIFGFSPYMLRMLQGSPHLYFVALVPLFVLLVLRRLDGSIGERRFFLAATLGVAAQYLTSNDVLATMTVFGALALVAAFMLYVEHRPLLFRTAAVLAAAYVAAAVVVSPMLFFMLFRDHTTPEQNTPFFANDLVSWLFPDSSLLFAESHEVGGTNPHFGGLAYFGIPLLVVVVLYAWQNRHRRVGRLAGVCFLAPAVAGLGHRLTIDGEITRIGLPWAAVDHLPGLKLLVPQRFPLYAFLAAAAIVAMWLASRPSRARWALVLLAVASMLPWVAGDYWKTRLSTPTFFTGGDYSAYLDEDDRVLAVPIIGDSMRWQAEERFRFDLAGGGVGAFPDAYTRYPVFSTLIFPEGPLPPDSGSELRRFVDDKGVTAVVVDKTALNPQRRHLFASLGVRPLDTGGVLLYRLRPNARSGHRRQRTNVARTNSPSRAVSFFPSSELRAR
jgi:hypothetical protein